MTNHFHLLALCPPPNLAHGMQRLLAEPSQGYGRAAPASRAPVLRPLQGRVDRETRDTRRANSPRQSPCQGAVAGPPRDHDGRSPGSGRPPFPARARRPGASRRACPGPCGWRPGCVAVIHRPNGACSAAVWAMRAPNRFRESWGESRPGGVETRKWILFFVHWRRCCQDGRTLERGAG